MDTLQASTLIDSHESRDTEADQSARDGANPSANLQNISDIPNGPEPSRTFSRMRKPVVSSMLSTRSSTTT